MDLLVLARDLGLVPCGVSFHVGSQQRDIGAWDAAISKVKVIFERLRQEDGIELELEDTVLAGPTCDSADIMYEDYYI